MVDKIIVTNRGALSSKYGQAASDIATALEALVKADKGRGLDSLVVNLDDSSQMAALGATPVTDAASDSQVKNAIDDVAKAKSPDYVLLIGAPDVVPYVRLDNPHHDDDVDVPSDLPYACEAPFSRTAADFLAPTRVLGRLPGVHGVGDPSFLLTAIDTATTWKSRSAADYRNYLAISAASFHGSTTGSCEAIFGSDEELKLSPPEGPDWADDTLARLTHYINCHGAARYPNWNGQGNNQYPVAQSAEWVAGKIAEGCVCVAQSCYGAMLYDPKDSHHPSDWPLANRYMNSRAYAVWGSTDTSFAPMTNNAAADLICQRFMKNLLTGASSGRAAQQARIDYVAHHPTHGPTDVKTVAQFVLLGDPSVHPVAAPAENAAPGARGLRRTQVASQAQVAAGAAQVAHAGGGAAPHPAVDADMKARLTAMGGTTSADIRSHAVQGYGAGGPSVVHVAVSERGASPLGRRNLAVVVVHEHNGQVHRVQELVSH